MTAESTEDDGGGDAVDTEEAGEGVLEVVRAGEPGRRLERAGVRGVDLGNAARGARARVSGAGWGVEVESGGCEVTRETAGDADGFPHVVRFFSNVPKEVHTTREIGATMHGTTSECKFHQTNLKFPANFFCKAHCMKI